MAKVNVYPYWCLHPKEIIPLPSLKVTSNFLVHLVCRLASIHLSQDSLAMEMLYDCDSLLIPGETLSQFFRGVVISRTATSTTIQDPFSASSVDSPGTARNLASSSSTVPSCSRFLVYPCLL